MFEAGAGHAFAEAAFFEEVFFEAADLLVEEVVGLVDEADGDVGEGSGRAVLEEGAIGFKGFAGGFTEFADVERFAGVFIPERLVADAEEVFVVDEEFFETRPGDVGELDFGFGRGQ